MKGESPHGFRLHRRNQGINVLVERKPCTLTRLHPPHTWWSRKMKCYFQCFGKRVES